MNDQMLRQLVLTNPYTDTADLLKEKEEYVVVMDSLKKLIKS
jgi:hypothetical protein